VTDVEEFLQYADECMKSAAEAQTDEKRKAFLDMARTWAEAAAKLAPEKIAPLVAAPSAATPPE
jgi:hypothetical protein